MLVQSWLSFNNTSLNLEMNELRLLYSYIYSVFPNVVISKAEYIGIFCLKAMNDLQDK